MWLDTINVKKKQAFAKGSGRKMMKNGICVLALCLVLSIGVVSCGGSGNTSVHSISGRAATLADESLQDVVMTLTGAESATTTTGADGNYSFTDLPNGDYTVSPHKAGYVFMEVSCMVSLGETDLSSVDFYGGELAAQLYGISGSVISAGKGLSGVKVVLDGNQFGSACTDADGAFQFSGLFMAVNNSYTITAEKGSFVFCPANHSCTINGGDVLNIVFDGYRVETGGTVVEMLRNNGMEDDNGAGEPLLWDYINCLSPDGTSPYMCSWTEESSHSSTHSLKIESNELDKIFSYWHQDAINIKTGSKPVLQAYIKAVNVSENGITLAVSYDYSGSGGIYTETKYDMNGTFDWTEYSLSLPVVTAQVEDIKVWLILESDTTGSAYFDDVSLSYVDD